MKRIAIIGAGPAGMIAALEVARQGIHPVLFDNNLRVGRKLITTGSGRCNFTNTRAAPSSYHSSDSSADNQFVAQALKLFGPQHLVDYFNELGILSYATDDGWFYPVSNSAANVVDIFEENLKLSGVNLQLNTRITNIQFQSKNKNFTLIGEKGGPLGTFNHVILATGGKAHPQLGAETQYQQYIHNLGHTSLPVLPALAPVITDARPLHKLQGVRTNAGLKLYRGKDRLIHSIGSIIFTKWGINGPGVMDLSYMISLIENDQENIGLQLHIDFVPHHKDELNKLISRHRSSQIPLRVILESISPPKIPRFILENAQIALDQPLSLISQDMLDGLLHTMTGFSVKVKGTRGFEYCQASTGGIPQDEISPETMQSKIKTGMFFAGEMIDVVGPCGGYNLQWAFTSGFIAGRAAVNF